MPDIDAHAIFAATFWAIPSPVGPFVMVYPAGQLPSPEVVAQSRELTAAEAWQLSELACDLAQKTSPDGQDECAEALIKRLWPMIEDRIGDLLEGPEGEAFRAWHAREARNLADELAWATREIAKDRGLAEAKEIIQTLVAAIAEPDHAARLMVLAANAGAIGRALGAP
jgi:hypothetical protein